MSYSPLELDIVNALLKCSAIQINGECGHYRKPVCILEGGLPFETVETILATNLAGVSGQVAEVAAHYQSWNWSYDHAIGGAGSINHTNNVCPEYNQGTPPTEPTRRGALWPWIAGGAAVMFITLGAAAYSARR